MQTATLSEVLNGRAAPYQKTLKVKVMAGDPIKTFTNEKGEEKKVLNIAIADNTKAVKAVVYDDTKFARLTVGKSIMIRNIIKKENHIVITNQTKIFTTQEVHVNDQVALAAKHIINPPSADVKPLKDALLSPKKVRVSIKGKIVQVSVMGIKYNINLSYMFVNSPHLSN